MAQLTEKDLAAYDGQDGRPAYVAHAGRVLDVTASKLWKTGRHMSRHSAGLDLTADFSKAPHGEDVLDRFPQVGTLVRSLAPEPAKNPDAERDAELLWLLRRFPFFRRHPHPMTVHFPIAFGVGAAAFLRLYLLTGSEAFWCAVRFMLLSGAVTAPVAFLTGLATWKYNYACRFIPATRILLIGGVVIMAQFLAGAAWCFFDPQVMALSGAAREIFIWLVFSLILSIGITGWSGAMLTFPLHK